jgi:hypothetical protein
MICLILIRPHYEQVVKVVSKENAIVEKAARLSSSANGIDMASVSR